MKAMRLMELIGEVDDRFIEESFGKPTVRRRKQYWTLAMAAVLALALIGGGAAYLRWGGNTWRAGSAAPADSAPAEAAAEDAVPAEGAWKGAEAPAACLLRPRGRRRRRLRRPRRPSKPPLRRRRTWTTARTPWRTASQA